MSDNPTFPQVAARLAPGYACIELYTLDCTPIGGGVYRWTPGPLNGTVVSLGGTQYQPMPIEGVDFEWNGQGPLPTPKLRISNVLNIPMGLLIANGDLLGAQVTRTRTFSCFLDGQPYADASATTAPDIFRVDRKSHADKNFVELELAASIDQQGKQLPFRVVLQNTCTQTYRVWDATTESFIQGSCPYTGSLYFNAYTVAETNPALDVCGRRLRDCIARFNPGNPSNAPSQQVDVTTVAGQPTLVMNAGLFDTADIGETVLVAGAGAGGSTWSGTLEAIDSSGETGQTVTLSTNAGTSLTNSNRVVSWGPGASVSGNAPQQPLPTYAFPGVAITPGAG